MRHCLAILLATVLAVLITAFTSSTGAHDAGSVFVLLFGYPGLVAISLAIDFFKTDSVFNGWLFGSVNGLFYLVIIEFAFYMWERRAIKARSTSTTKA